MTYKQPEPDDPHMLVGVSVPATAESLHEMAATFAEEFAAMGFGQERLLALFRQPFYAGAHRAYRALGEPVIRTIIRESLAFWGGRRVAIRYAAPAAGDRLIRRGSRPGDPGDGLDQLD